MNMPEFQELRPTEKAMQNSRPSATWSTAKAVRKASYHAWLDTCCIDKANATELQETINSMFKWYARAALCVAFLDDIPTKPFEGSIWWTRGWTLQVS